MSAQVLKNTNIGDLPESGDIHADDYLIIHNDELTTRVKFKDLYITKENTTFGQEINDLYEKIEALSGSLDSVAISNDTYSKTEMDDKLASKSNTGSSMTSAEIDNKYYTRSIVDAKLNSRAGKIDVYIKSEVDSLISGAHSEINRLSGLIDQIYTRIEKLEKIHDPG
jgi:hypothetical protein